MEHTPLAGLQRLGDYRAQRVHVFPSENALTWFVRRHRSELIEAGALMMITGQWHAVGDRFDAFVIEAGKRAALRRTEAGAQ